MKLLQRLWRLWRVARVAVEAIDTVLLLQHQLIACCSRLSRFHSAKTARYMHSRASRRTKYTAMVSARRKTPRLARGLVHPRAKIKTDRSHGSEFHSELR